MTDEEIKCTKCKKVVPGYIVIHTSALTLSEYFSARELAKKEGLCPDCAVGILDERIKEGTKRNHNRLGESDKKVTSEPAPEVVSPKTPNPTASAKRFKSNTGRPPAKRPIKHVSKKLRNDLRKIWAVDEKEAEPKAKPRTKRVGDNKK